MAYDAFISYSHAADGRLAPALQSGLQRLAKPWYRLRALRVFRDETSLSTNPQLWSSIEAALDESERFVLLASPDSARSPWVDKEIAHWLATKPADRILSVLTSGSWEWDPTAGRLVGDAVPERLAAALVEEPRHLDLRWAAAETDLDLRNSGFRSAVADLAAPMHGVAKDELEGEDIRQHRRARRLARAAVTTVVVLLIVAIVFGGYAINERDRANSKALDAELRGLVSESRALLTQDRPLAMLLADEAYRRRPNANASDALLTAVVAEPRLRKSLGPAAGVFYAGRLTGPRVAVAASEPGPGYGHGYDLSVWNWSTGRQETWPAAPRASRGCANTNPVGLATSLDGELIAVVTADGLLHTYSGATLEPRGKPVSTGLEPFPACDAQVVFSPNARWLAVANGSNILHGTTTGKTVALFERPRDVWQPGPAISGHRIRVDALAFSKDSSILATGSPGGNDANPGLIVLHDVRTGNTVQTIVSRDAGVFSLALDWDRRRLVVGSLNDNSARVYNLDAPSEPKPIPGTSLGSVTRPVYNADWTQLGISGTAGFRLLDGANLEPIKPPDIEPNTAGGPALFLPDEQILLVGYVGPMTVWDLRSTSVLQSIIPQPAPLAPTANPDVFITSRSTSDGTFLTFVGPGYRALTPELRVGPPKQFGPTWCADPRTNQIATIGKGAGGHPGEIVVRRGGAPFAVMRRAPGVDFEPIACAWRPDGKQIAIGGTAGEVALWEVANGRMQRLAAHLHQFALSLAYRPDSTELWVTGIGGVPERITHLDGTPRITPALPALGVVNALRFTPDGRFVVIGDALNVQVLDARTLAPVTDRIPATTNQILLVDVSPDGHFAVASDFAGHMRRVDLRAGRVIGPPLGITLPGLGLFGQDDSTVYASTSDNRAAVWNFAPDHVRDEACAVAGRNLTQQEWHTYLPWAGPRRATCPQYA